MTRTTATISHDDLADLALADGLPRFGAKWGVANLRKKYEETLPDVMMWMPSLRCITFEVKVSIEDYRRDAKKRGERIGDEHWYVVPAGMVERVQGSDGLIWYDGDGFSVVQTPAETSLDEPTLPPTAEHHSQFRRHVQMRIMLHLLARRGCDTINEVSAKKRRAKMLDPLIDRVAREGRVKIRAAANTIGMGTKLRSVLEMLRDHPSLCIVEEAGIRYVEAKEAAK